MKHPWTEDQLAFLMASTDQIRKYLRWANWLIYASVFLGVLLLGQLYALRVDLALLIPIFVGWIFYLIVAIMIWTGRAKAYPAALVLAIVILAVSLPQPEHLSLAEAGLTLASFTFIIGSILQVGVIILIGYSMIAARKRSA